MSRLVIARHGQSEGDTLELIEGSADLPLTVTGRLQGALLAERLEADYRPAAVFSSPLRRAREIAAATASRLAVPLFVDPRLAEEATGALSGVPIAEAVRRWPLPRRGHLTFERFPGGESVIDRYARVMEFTLNLLDVLGETFPGVWGRRTIRFQGECESTRDLAPWEPELKAALNRRARGGGSAGSVKPDLPTLALVVHGGTAADILRVLLGIPVNAQVRFPHGDTGLDELEVRDGLVTVLRENCQRHLPPVLRAPGSRDVAADDPTGVEAAVAAWRKAGENSR